MTTQHTPGPWKVVQSFYPAIKEVSGASFKISCVMWATDLNEEDYQKRDADLALIAAAPDLLEALKEIAADYADRFDLDDPSTNPGIKYTIKQARAAITKATGDTL
jgi:hypothetical protein